MAEMMIGGWTAIEDRGYLALKGPDAVRFLNGQVTNNVEHALSGKTVPACICSIKGKVEALVFIRALPSGEGLLIETEAAQVEEVFNRLDRYLIADDCELSVLEDPPRWKHVIGGQSDGGVECWRFGIQGFDVEEPAGLEGDEIPGEKLRYLKLIHGIPESGFEITGEEFPSELGLDRWVVDFHKGCYLGQEVVSRIESVGKTKHQLLLCRTEGAFARGHSFENDSGKELARVTRDSLPDPGGEGLFLTPVYARSDFDRFESIEIRYPANWI